MKGEPKKEPYDLTEKASNRGAEPSTQVARQQESDAVNESKGLGIIPTPEGDRWGESKVATSLDEK